MSLVLRSMFEGRNGFFVFMLLTSIGLITFSIALIEAVTSAKASKEKLFIIVFSKVLATSNSSAGSLSPLKYLVQSLIDLSLNFR